MTGTDKRHVARSARHIWSDVKQMIALRRRLLETEARSDLSTVKRFGVLAAVGCTLCLFGVFVLGVLLAGLLDGWIDRSQVPLATVSLGALALLGGGATLLSARRGFRRQLLCFRESRAEIQEDLLWMREWIDDELSESAREGEFE